MRGIDGHKFTQTAYQGYMRKTGVNLSATDEHTACAVDSTALCGDYLERDTDVQMDNAWLFLQTALVKQNEVFSQILW